MYWSEIAFAVLCSLSVLIFCYLFWRGQKKFDSELDESIRKESEYITARLATTVANVKIREYQVREACFPGLIARIDKSQNEQPNQWFRFENTVGMASSMADGLLLSKENFLNALSVTDGFKTAVEHLAHKHFESFSDLSGYLASLKHDPSILRDVFGLTADKAGYFHGIPMGTIQNLKGHLGEAFVVKYFEDAGRTVAMAANGSQPGWDILIDGKEVQVKIVKDFASVLEHQAQYPDIPVVLNADASGIPDSVHHISAFDTEALAAWEFEPESVLALEGLTNEVTLEATKGAVSGSMSESVTLKFPWITAAVSSWREVKLHNSGKTDLATSLKNTSFDMVGTAGGAFAGAKVGAIVGSFFGPAGSGLGGIIGGIGGAIGGRIASDSAKASDAQRALKKLNDAALQMETDVSKTIDTTFEKVKVVRMNFDVRFRDFQSRHKKDLQQIVADHDRIRTVNSENLAFSAGDILQNQIEVRLKESFFSFNPVLYGYRRRKSSRIQALIKDAKTMRIQMDVPKILLWMSVLGGRGAGEKLLNSYERQQVETTQRESAHLQKCFAEFISKSELLGRELLQDIEAISEVGQMTLEEIFKPIIMTVEEAQRECQKIAWDKQEKAIEDFKNKLLQNQRTMRLKFKGSNEAA